MHPDTKTYLDILFGNRPVMWAWRSDKGNDFMHTETWDRSDDTTALYLEQINSKGNGIFCLINESMSQWGRKRSEIVRAHAVWADVDGTPLRCDMKPDPTMVVRTRNGFHLYYVLQEPTSDIAWAEGMNRRIANEVGGDMASCDACRVLRVPGFCHHKGEPYLVTLCHVGQRYTKSALEAAFGAPERLQETSYDCRGVLPLPAQEDSSWGVSAALKEKYKVEAAPVGMRNRQLCTSAFKLGQIVGAGRLTEDTVFAFLGRAAQINGYLEEEGIGSVMATIRSGMERGKESPRG